MEKKDLLLKKRESALKKKFKKKKKNINQQKKKMAVLSDKWIKKIALGKGMIKPFVSKQVRKGKISFGLSSYGYDARVSNEFKIFTNVNSGIVDPKIFKKESFVTKIGKECIIPPNSFALARTVEYFKIPDNVLVICLGKSTYARCGIIVNVTPLEPGWEGHVTLEFSNTTPLPAKIYANEGVAQFIFIKGNEKPEITYAKRKGKYMKQKGRNSPKGIISLMQKLLIKGKKPSYLELFLHLALKMLLYQY